MFYYNVFGKHFIYHDQLIKPFPMFSCRWRTMVDGVLSLATVSREAVRVMRSSGVKDGRIFLICNNAYDVGLSSLNGDTTPLNEHTVCLNENMASLNEDTAPLNKETSSVNENTALSNESNEALQRDTTSLNEDTAVLNEDTSSSFHCIAHSMVSCIADGLRREMRRTKALRRMRVTMVTPSASGKRDFRSKQNKPLQGQQITSGLVNNSLSGKLNQMDLMNDLTSTGTTNLSGPYDGNALLTKDSCSEPNRGSEVTNESNAESMESQSDGFETRDMLSDNPGSVLETEDVAAAVVYALSAPQHVDITEIQFSTI